jgi:pimeloyl-ACP methyl ester carboxylesterase
VVDRKLPAAALVMRGPAIAPEDLAGLKTRCLVVIGSEDPNLATIGEELRRRPRIEVAIIPGATHLMPEPGALEASARSIACFLEERVKPRATPSAA